MNRSELLLFGIPRVLRLLLNEKRVGLVFKVTQHAWDSNLLNSFVNYFKCGRFYKSSDKVVDFIVNKLSDISNKIIVHFDKYPLEGAKILDYNGYLAILTNMTSANSL